jgi:hypothetical protein
LVHKEPPIPRAIPAPSSPLKPLDRSLENKTGETNVYIRGLLPETTDDMLLEWGNRFGDIQSSKSIIDLKSNLCKGHVFTSTNTLSSLIVQRSFGFIKYHNFEDAENCIRGFHYLGYEVSFARVGLHVIQILPVSVTKFHQESFYAKLKKFADESNTNLYVSNIPKNMNEHVSILFFLSAPEHCANLPRNLVPYLPPTKCAPVGYSVTTPATAVGSASLDLKLVISVRRSSGSSTTLPSRSPVERST